MVVLRCVRNCMASTLGLYLCLRANYCTSSLVSALIAGLSFIALDTVEAERFNALAMSFKVIYCLLIGVNKMVFLKNKDFFYIMESSVVKTMVRSFVCYNNMQITAL